MSDEKPKQNLAQKIVNFPSRNMENAPSASGQLVAVWREALKDVNDKLHQVFFGGGTGQGEPGTPLVPTQMMVNQDLGAVKNPQMEDYAPKGISPKQKEKDLER
jgi:hypothetical protein